jgi:type IV pilus modification protein PilV
MQDIRMHGRSWTVRPAATSGFTLLEVMVALAVLTVGLLGFTSFFVVNARTHDYVSERTLAIHSLREVAETVRSSPFSAAAVNYNGYTFTIGDIKASGKVTMFTDETDNSFDAKNLGLPRDLDGDGLASNKNILGGYYLLPIKIEVSWTNVEGPQSMTLYQMLAQEVN